MLSDQPEEMALREEFNGEKQGFCVPNLIFFGTYVYETNKRVKQIQDFYGREVKICRKPISFS